MFIVNYQADSSGINSLAGFAYQIRVFALYAFKLEENMILEFETIEDVNIKSIKSDEIDKLECSIICKSNIKTTNLAIQVKHTTVSDSTAQKMILNWLLLEKSEHEISQYILLSDESYKNNGGIFKDDAKKFFDIISKTTTKSNSTISKVKTEYENNLSGFKTAYKSIQKKYKFENIKDINSLISVAASNYFRKVADEVVFYQRLEEFLARITREILDEISKKRPYKLSFENFIKIIEEISSNITNKFTAPSYTDFKKVHPIDLTEDRITKSREYLQLKACNLTEEMIIKHLSYGLYYYETALKYYANNRRNKVEDILETAFSNYEDAKYELIISNNDTPFYRLKTTKEKDNSNAENEQIRFGAAIYLTKEEIDENQVSWEDEDNQED